MILTGGSLLRRPAVAVVHYCREYLALGWKGRALRVLAAKRSPESLPKIGISTGVVEKGRRNLPEGAFVVEDYPHRPACSSGKGGSVSWLSGQLLTGPNDGQFVPAGRVP